MTTQFREEQKMTQWWIWALLFMLLSIAVYTFIQQNLLGNPVGNNPMPDYGVYIFLIFTIVLNYFIWKIKLITKVDEEGIHLIFIPFFKKQYLWTDIDSAEIVKYGFLGYGIRYSPKYGVVYNIDGPYGLALDLKNGKKRMIGTQKKEELQEWLNAYAPINV